MRFPRLTNLFHRRVKSDPEIHRLASAPIANPQTRPLSSSYIAELAFPPSLSTSDSDLFNSFVPNGPFSPPRLPPLVLSPTLPVHVPPTDPAAVQPTFRYRASDPVEHHNQGVLSILTQRIRDLETALLEECEASSSIASLAAALEAERTARQAAEAANGALTENVSLLQGEVLQLRRDLFFALTSQPTTSASAPSASASTSTGSDSIVRTESGELVQHGYSAVLAERDRLRYFLELMVSAGTHKPVLEASYQQVIEGEDPEAALVNAIKSAAAQRASVWHRLLEPVVGVRTQNEYLAQLRCTLDARRHTMDWRKRAKFWKGAAKEEGRHVDTVTPSVSALSDVALVLPQDRQETVEVMTIQLRKGELPLRLARTMTAVSEPEAHSAIPLNSAALGSDFPSGGASVVLDSAVSGELPAALSEAFSASSSGGQSDLVAMAELDNSLVDRVSMPPDDSIPAASSSMVLPAVSSNSTARFSAYSNLPPLASQTFRASHSIKDVPSRGPRRGMTPSASATSHASAKSRRRRTQILVVPLPAVTPSNSSHSADPVIFVASPSGSRSAPTMPLSQSALAAQGSLPRALVDFGRGSDEDLVLVLSTDFADTSYCSSHGRDGAGSSSGSSTPTSAQSTPEKKSRLPVRMPGLKAIKRLSASIGSSRPALADVSNAPVPEFASLSGESEKRGKKEKAGPGLGGRRRAQTIATQKVSADSERSTKIPMGRRLQRFGLRSQADRR